MSTELNLATVMADLLEHGCSRVVINDEAEAMPPRRAKEEFGMTPEIIFIRDDGWTLGAPQMFRRQAYGTWHDKWVAFIERPGIHPRPMTEFVP